MLGYIGVLGTALKKGELPPDDSQENLILAHDVSFNEATTESVQQMSLNFVILRQYGIAFSTYSKVSQFLSLGVSMISIILSFTKVCF